MQKYIKKKMSVFILHAFYKVWYDKKNIVFVKLLNICVLVCFFISRKEGPITADDAFTDVSWGCEKNEEKLLQTWFQHVIKVYDNGDLLKRLPKEQQNSFFSCAETLISNQVRLIKFIQIKKDSYIYKLTWFS